MKKWNIGIILLLVALLQGCISAGVQSTGDIDYSQRRGEWQWGSEHRMQFNTQGAYKLTTQSAYIKNMLTFYNTEREQREFRASDKIILRYDAFNVNPQKQTAFVLLHGAGQSSLHLVELIHDLVQQNPNAAIYALNLRGLGFSQRLVGTKEWSNVPKNVPQALYDYQKVHVDNFQSYIDDVDLFLNNIVNVDSYAKVFAIGHSLGGTILARYIAQHPNKLTAVALSSPSFALQGIIPGLSTNLVSKTMLETQLALGNGKEYASNNQPYNPRIPFMKNRKMNPITSSLQRFNFNKYISQANPILAMGGVTWQWSSELAKAMAKFETEASKISDPVLILQAGDDQLIDTSAHEGICNTINSKRQKGQATLCKLTHFPLAQHDLLIEKDEIRNAVLDEIMLFFGQ